MLKIPKGLKKKKKGKKKKDQELFTEEELEQYKQEQARKAAEAVAAAEQAQVSGETQADKEEWSQFAALTTGIDTVLKKTQDDLDRIKTTSFFQRVAPKIEETKDSEPEEPEEDEETKKERQMQALKEAVVELSESEYESEEDTNIFDTEYIDTVGNAELPLAYIPDSPTIEEAEGDDPFDTAYAEKVIKGPEVSKSGKKIVSIGAAVHVLTGQVDNIPKSTIVKRPKRRGIQNLMLSSFDAENEEPAKDGQQDTKEAEHEKHDPLDSLLELPPDEIENVEIDLSVSLHMKYNKNEQKESENREETTHFKNDDIDVLKEFDVLKDEEDDEFAQLAAESLHKPIEAIRIVDQIPVLEPVIPDSTDWAEFEQTDEPVPETAVGIVDDEDIDIPMDDDPFNTTFVEAVLPKVDSFEELARESLTKAPKKVSIAEPIHTEVNLLNDDENPTILINSQTRDELARRKSSLSLSINNNKTVQFCVPTPDPMKSDIEFSALIRKPLTPYYSNDESEENTEAYVDPFDTSFVPNVAPTRIELNMIEKEMLKNLDDDDFDPRAVTPEPIPVQQEKVTHPESTAKESIAHVETDPFGNAIFEEDKYSALAVIDDARKEPKELEKDELDILTTTLADASVDVKVLTPQLNPVDSFEIADIDPFDTTFAENIRPGETELKFIESELIH